VNPRRAASRSSKTPASRANGTARSPGSSTSRRCKPQLEVPGVVAALATLAVAGVRLVRIARLLLLPTHVIGARAALLFPCLGVVGLAGHGVSPRRSTAVTRRGFPPRPPHPCRPAAAARRWDRSLRATPPRRHRAGAC